MNFTEVIKLTRIVPLPDMSGLERLLGQMKGKTGYILELRCDQGRLVGNNGDFLMHIVFERILRHLDIKITTVAEAADILLLPPNGALLQNYTFPLTLRKRLNGLPRIPLIIFPSSALFPTQDPSIMFGNRGRQVHWILRDAYSYAHLKEDWGRQLSNSGVELALDHDVVVSGHSFVHEIVGAPLIAKTLLVSCRNDRELSKSAMSKNAGLPITSQPKFVSRVAAKIPYGPWITAPGRAARRSRQIRMGEQMLGQLPQDLQTAVAQHDRRDFCDISATQFATFDEYRRKIRNADIVVTNRLHVGLPAAVLGKRVILIEGGYHKIAGVYGQSLQGQSNISMISSC